MLLYLNMKHRRHIEYTDGISKVQFISKICIKFYDIQLLMMTVTDETWDLLRHPLNCRKASGVNLARLGGGRQVGCGEGTLTQRGRGMGSRLVPSPEKQYFFSLEMACFGAF